MVAHVPGEVMCIMDLFIRRSINHDNKSLTSPIASNFVGYFVVAVFNGPKNLYGY